MSTNLTTKSGNIKPIAKNDLTARIEKHFGTNSFPENLLLIEDEELPTDCPHFYNRATESQKAYVKKLIEDRMLREEIDPKWLVFSLAELFEYEVLNAHGGSSSLNALLKVLYKNPSFLNDMQSYEKTRAIETVETMANFLDCLGELNGDTVLFDYAKIENKMTIPLSDIIDMQRKHAERKIVDDGVFVFDLAFSTPFNKLSEEAKVDRLRLYLREHEAWTDETLVLPEYVKPYLPKAQELLEKEENPNKN